MANCPLFGRRKKPTSPPLHSNISDVGMSIPRLLSPSPMNVTNTSTPTALQTALQKLICSVPADLVPVLGDLSALTKRIERTPANVHSLGDLTALLDSLRPTVTELLERNTNQGQTFVEDLKRELQSLTEDLEAAWSQDRLDKFFSAAAHTTSFEKHSLALVQIIADSAIVTAHEVLECLRETGGRKLHIDQSSPAIRGAGRMMSGDVAGDIENTFGFEYVLNNSAQEDSAMREATPIPAVRVAKAKGPSLIWIPTKPIESATFPAEQAGLAGLESKQAGKEGPARVQ
ncbi:hypothetical protein DFH08DRAFT_1078316 [Mycena albidolilacea]|uniref:Uncharacterized protein n=1 Tax=Mycena albidolilacea TaxID=1033008 RepID=A0AAD7EVW6_9AGAR|nr:hypothetical protein DFH08DRAFT_1078316 [Mycena albidolilacea]